MTIAQRQKNSRLFYRSDTLHKVLLTFIFLVFTTLVYSQARNVSGIVSDATTREPLVGATVLVKGTSNGAVTDLDGKYSINVPDGLNALVFSYMGYLSEEVDITDRIEINVSLSEDITQLNEVVVVGYGTMRKRDVAGSITSVKREDITAVKSGNALESLQGKVAGMDIYRSSGRAGEGVSMSIRGARSLVASNEPLVVVDGIPYGSNIDINQNEIASIEVLKDASSTAIYGSRGANGVILITTKKGDKNKGRIYFNSYYGIAEASQKIPVYDREGYIKAKIDAYRDTADWNAEPPIQNVFTGNEAIGYENGTETNWQDEVFKKGTQQDYLLGFSGGNEKTTYNASINYFKEEGVVVADKFERFSLNNNVDSKVTDRIGVGVSTILSYKIQDGRGPRFTDALLLSPIVPAYDSIGKYVFQPAYGNPRNNPLAYTDDKEEIRTTRAFSTMYAELKLSNSLSFRTNLGADYETVRFGYMYPQKHVNDLAIRSGVSSMYNLSILWNNVLSFRKSWGEHSLSVTAAQELINNRQEIYGFNGENQESRNTLWYNLSSIRDLTQKYSSMADSSMLSYLGRIHYTYAEKYILQVSGRYDGASQLTPDDRWDFFPSASIAWRINKEEFLANAVFINDLKLRIGYGVSGNASVNAYATNAILNTEYPMYYQFGDPGEEVPAYAYRPIKLASKFLRWEPTEQINFGIDYSLFKNRITGTFDYYLSKTTDLILNDKLPPTTGFDYITANVGETETNGFEASLHTINIKAGDFEWSSDFTFFTNKMKITKLSSGVTRDVANGWFVGHPSNVIYDFNKLGIWQLSEVEEARKYSAAPGDIKVEDINNDDTISFDDRIILGQESPKWTGDLSNRFSYKGIELSFSIYARMGQTIEVDAYAFDPRMYDNMLEVNYWTPNNPTNEYPRYDSKKANTPYSSTLTYLDGSFIKMKHITAGYNFPKSVLGRTPLSTVYAYFSVKNPLTLYTKLKDGIDPERNGSTSWPYARTFVFGLNIEF